MAQPADRKNRLDTAPITRSAPVDVDGTVHQQFENWVWDSGTTSWVRMTQPGASSVGTVSIGFAPTLVIGLMPSQSVTVGTVWIGGGISTVNISNSITVGTVWVGGGISTVNIGNTVNAAQSGAWGVTASINNIPSINGIVSISNSPTVVVGNSTLPVTQSGAWGVTATVNFATQTISVGNVPAVSQSGAWGVTATVNFGGIGIPTVVVGNSTIAVTQSGGWSVGASISNQPTVSIGNSPAVTVSNGSLNATILHGKTLKSSIVSLVVSGNVVSGVSGKVLKVYAVRVIADASTAVAFQDNTTLLEGAAQLSPTSGWVESVTPPGFLFKTTASLPLGLSIVPSVHVGGRVSYWDDDAS